MVRMLGLRRVQVIVMSLAAVTVGYGFYLRAGSPGASSATQPAGKEPVKPLASKDAPAKTWEFAAFEERLFKHQNMTYDDLLKGIKPKKFLDKLSFDPTKAEFYDRVSQKLALTDPEIALFKKNGFVSLDLNARHSMGSAYHDIFKKDLPVLVTTDSMLHALHRSFDAMLMDLERGYFASNLSGVLANCQTELKKTIADNPAGLADNCKDVDLFLTVAANLLQGAAAKDGSSVWDGKILTPSVTGIDDQVLDVLKKIEQRSMVRMPIYGGSRRIDFTQFVPRGHYTKSDDLRRYFLAMMWLGRADTGWFMLPVQPSTGIICDDQRELRNAMLLARVLDRSGARDRLQQMDEAINFMIGRSDNLSVFQLRDLMGQEGVKSVADIAAAQSVKRMQEVFRAGKHARPMIVSLVLNSSMSPGPQVPAPAQFQFFGQRFAIDSFVFSQVVFDTIVYQGQKMERRLPTGLDAIAALGSNDAIPLLHDELEKWKYSANLRACRDFVEGVAPDFWKDNLYNIWLDSLRTFNTDRTAQKHFPEVMKTQTWQRKELQTQLGSWAELRHDTILYVKQSYSRASCEYPAGYVEPYPEFYAKLRQFTDKAQELFVDWKLRWNDQDPRPKHYRDFFQNFSRTLGKLEALARKELKAEAFTKEDSDFVKKTLTSQPNCDGTPIYDGWYPKLYFDEAAFDKWEPTIADVHTDPHTARCLEVGVGEINLCVIAIDNEQHRRVYVGPIYSYYEFPHPMGDRLTDEAWQKQLETNRAPARPPWVSGFQAAPRPQGSARRQE